MRSDFGHTGKVSQKYGDIYRWRMPSVFCNSSRCRSEDKTTVTRTSWSQHVSATKGTHPGSQWWHSRQRYKLRWLTGVSPPAYSGVMWNKFHRLASSYKVGLTPKIHILSSRLLTRHKSVESIRFQECQLKEENFIAPAENLCFYNFLSFRGR